MIDFLLKKINIVQ